MARRSQEIDWFWYVGKDPLSVEYELTTGLVHGIPPLRTNKRSQPGSRVIADIPGHEAGCLQDIQLPIVTSYEDEWLEYGGAAGSCGAFEVDVVDLAVSGDLELLLERDSKWTANGGPDKPGLQKE